MADFLAAVGALASTTVLFRVRGRKAVANATRSAMARPALDAESATDRNDEIWRVYRAARWAKRLWPARVMCLQTSFVLQRVLLRRGISSTLVIGTSPGGDPGEGLTAHAWLRVGNYVIDDQRLDGRFVAFESIAPHSGEATS